MQQNLQNLESAASSVLTLTLIGMACVIGNIGVTIWLIIDNVIKSRGTNRLVWLLVIPIPLVGPISYLTVGRKEQKQQRSIEEPPPLPPKPTRPQRQQLATHTKPIRWKDI